MYRPNTRRDVDARAIRSRRTVLVLCIVMLAMLTSVAHAAAGANSWTQTYEPRGGYISNFEVTPGGHILAAALYDGAYTSADGGATWTTLGDEFDPAVNVCWDLAVSDTPTYFAATDNGIYKTTSPTQAWVPAATGLEGVAMSSVIVDSDGTVIAGANNSPVGIYRSTDGGATWVVASTNVPAAVPFLASTDTTIVAGTYSDGLWVSDNQGEEWTKSTTGIPGGADVLGVGFNGDVWFAATSEGIYRSVNAGGSWSLVCPGSYTDITVLPGGTVVAAEWQTGIVRSINGGDTWALAGSGNPSRWPDSVCNLGTSVLAGYRGLGVYRSAAAASSPWVASNTGLVILSSRCVGFGPGEQMFVSADTKDGYAAGLLKSTDMGASWTSAGYEFGGNWTYDLATSPLGDFYAAGSNGVWVTTDGDGWAKVGGDLSSSVTAVAVSSDGDMLLAAGNGWTATKHTADPDWTYVTTDGLPAGWSYSAEIAANGSLLVSRADALYRLAPGDLSWTPVTSETGVIYSMARRNDGRLYASGSMTTTTTALFKSTDNGASWAPLGLTGDVRSISVLPYGNFMFACRMNNGVYRSIDDGASWQLAMTGDAQALNVAAQGAFGPLLMGRLFGVGVYEFVLPEVSLSITPTAPAAVDGWYKGPRSIKLDRPVAATTYYRIDTGGTSSTLAASVTFPALEGSHTVTYYGSTWGIAQSSEKQIVRVDSTVPSGTVMLEGGTAKVSKQIVSVDSAVTDSDGSGVADMRVWVNGAWGAWKPYAAKTYVMLPGYDGTKTVKVEYRDKVGNVAQLTDTILYLRPKAVVSTPVLTPTSPTHGVSFSVKGTVTPKVYGSDKVFVYRKNAAGSWSYWGTFFAPNTASGSGSAYSASIKLGRTGSYRLRVYYPGSSTVAPNSSAWRYFTVK